MSIKTMSAVWEHYPGGGSELLALLALADWSDDDGRCFPSVASIARKTRLSKSQAQRVVHGLIDSGVVQVEGNETGGAPGATRRYRILVDRLTGSAGATGSAHDTRRGRISATGSAGATGRTDAADGSHPCGETGSTHATQTVIEPSITVKRGAQAAPTTPKTAKPKREEVTLTEYLDARKAAGVKPIPRDHPLHQRCVDTGITSEMLALAWLQFKRRYTTEASGKGKKYKDWPGTFANAVFGRWGVVKLWHFAGESGQAEWTSDGLAFKRAEEARLQREVEHA